MTLARLFRFRLRTLLLLTAVVSLMLSAWSVWVRPYREQQAALKELSRLGASTNARAANAPAWVTPLVGEKNFVEVFAVWNVGAAGDDDLAHLPQLVFLESLDLEKSRITDQVGARLGTLRQLKMLNLARTQISDGTLSQLGQLVHLETLDLRYVEVSDDSAAVLSRLRSLRQLKLTGTDLSDESVESLVQLQQLEELYLRWTRITPEGARRLRESLPDAQIHYIERPAPLHRAASVPTVARQWEPRIPFFANPKRRLSSWFNAT